MKSHLRLAFLASLCPGIAIAGGARDIDIYRELVRYRAAHTEAGQSFAFNTNQFLGQLVDDPTSFYSDLSDNPRITNEIWWDLFTDSLPMDRATASRTALNALAWHAGLSKARPGIEVTVDEDAIRAYGGRESAANAIKAGVDADIFLQAADMNGTTKTVAAGYAVALQMLRDQMAATDPSEYDRHAIKADVFHRYMAQRYPDRISESDERYLADLLGYEIDRHGSSADADERHSLPAAYRVARVAAAYADRNGYVTPSALCAGNAPAASQPTNPAEMEYPRPLCFIAATDRAVQAWYRRELRTEAALLRQRGHSESSSVMRVVGKVLLLIDFVSFIEVVEAALAEELEAAGTLEEAEAESAYARRQNLICRVAR